MALDLKITGGIVITDSQILRAELGIADGKVAVLAAKIAEPASKTIDATGCYILPGGIDPHVHLSLPSRGTVSSDDFTTGTCAAACGGVTTIIDFAIQDTGSLLEAIQRRRTEADPRVCVDYSLHAGIVRWDEETRKEIVDITRMGITSFKLFMAYRKEGLMADDFTLLAALRETARCRGLVGVHAENVDVMEGLTARLLRDGKKQVRHFPESRPDFVEEEAVQRAVHWARVSEGNLYIFHLSSRRGANAVAAARATGVKVYGETCGTYLELSDERFKESDGHLFATCPPIRTAGDRARLWQALIQGDVDVLATDHCAFTREQKEIGRNDFTQIPYGMPSVEVNLPLVFSEGVSTGRMGLNRFVRVTSTNPAKLFGLYPTKGSLQIGSDADVVIWDPHREVTLRAHDLHMRVDWCPFEGTRVLGYPRMTLLRGAIVYEDGHFLGKPGEGRFLVRGPVQHLTRW